jgi:hypothetical protein
MKSLKNVFAFPALSALLLLNGCGGGSGGGTVTPPPPPPQLSDFSVTVDQSKFPSSGLAIGASVTAQVSVAAVGSGDSNYQVNLTAAAPTGVTVTLGQASLAPGGTTTLTFATDGSVIAPVTIPVQFTGTRASDGKSHDASFSAKLVIGGGTLDIEFDASVPQSALAYLTKLKADVFDSGLLYDTCGSASASRKVVVVIDPTYNEFTSNFNGGSPTIHLMNLPNPDASGVDKREDEIFIHEGVHSLRNDIIGLQQTASGGGLLFAPDEEGFATGCGRLVMQKLAESQTRPSYENLGYEASTRVEMLASPSIDPLALMGIRARSPYSTSMYSFGEGAYRYLIGPQGAPSYKALNEAYYAAFNAKGGLLTLDDRKDFLNSVGVIDGMSAGNRFAATPAATVFLQQPATTNTTKFIALPSPTSYYVDGFIGLAWTITNNAEGPATYTPIQSGTVTIEVLNSAGADALPLFTTDLANTTSSPAPFSLGLENKLPAGGYTLVVKCVKCDANGEDIVQRIAVAVVPQQFQGVLSPDTPGSSHFYAISVDANGNASNAALNVTEGNVLYLGSGAAQGIAVIDAPKSTGEVIVNGQKFTVPPSGSAAGNVK